MIDVAELEQVLAELTQRVADLEQRNYAIRLAETGESGRTIAVKVRGKTKLEFDVNSPNDAVDENGDPVNPGLSFPPADPSYYVSVNIIDETVGLHTGDAPDGTDDTEYYQIKDSHGRRRCFGDIHVPAF